MMMYKNILRCFHTNSSLWALDKGILAKLRRKTGYSVSSCRKALDNNENDIEKAETWLNDRAKSEGWAKVASLSDRTTGQSLLGVCISGNRGSIVEVKCETDFVARNETFTRFVSHVAKTCLYNSSNKSDGEFVKEHLKEQQILDLKDESGTSLADTLALTVGSMKEKMQFQHAVTVTGGVGVDLVGLAHPQSSNFTGKHATILALRNSEADADISKQLCLHVIGMKPTEIGTEEQLEDFLKIAADKEAKAIKAAEQKIQDAKVAKQKKAEEQKLEDLKTAELDSKEDNKKKLNNKKKLDIDSESSDEESSDEDAFKIDQSNLFVCQEFFGDEDVLVGQVLKEHDIKVIDFVRLSSGESIN